MEFHQFVQFGLLALCIPLQLLVSSYIESPQPQREMALKQMVTGASQLTSSYLSWDQWRTWCVNVLSNWLVIKPLKRPVVAQGECIPTEVMHFMSSKGYFAWSPEVRKFRPENLEFRIGQVVRHKRWGYRGVIVGWDIKAKAPQDWLQQMHGSKEHWSRQPNYAVLVDSRDRSDSQTTYVVQENLELLGHTQITHSELKDYFDAFDGHRYTPRDALARLYPLDV